jgi:general secretion pathway protein D
MAAFPACLKEGGRAVQFGRVFSALVVSVLLAGCALFGAGEHVALGDRLMQEGNWEGAAAAYQQALREEPFNPALQAKVSAAKGRAAAVHYERGRAAARERNLPQAIESLKRAMSLDLTHPEYQAALAEAFRFKEAQERLAVGLKLLKAGRLDDAAESFERALELDPDLKSAQEGLIQLAEKQKAGPPPLAGSRQPVTLKFQNARTKEVFEVLARSVGINILFDKDMKDDPVTIFVKDAPFDEALHLILTTQNLFMRRLAADTILIIPKTKQKMDQYQDLLIRTFYLSNAKAKDMVNLLRTMLETKRLFVNEDVNAIVMRDSADKVRLAERIILANDRKPGEVMFEIEVLEVNKTKNQTLGVKFAKQAGAGFVPPGSAAFPGTGATSPSLFTYSQLTNLGPASYLFTLPSAVLLDFFKSEADTKTLANPKVRVVNTKQAKVNIGDKVPILLSNTTSNVATTPGTVPTTSTITSIEFKDTGVKVTVEPNIHLNNDVTIKLQLEVTRLGALQALGNGQSQFTFGTRTAETTLSLKDGESVVIGGLIQDEDRTTVEKVPGLGDIPVLGGLFKTTTTSAITTDVILTITPRIVRSLEIPGMDDQAFWSGTEETYALKQLFSEAGPGKGLSAAPVSRPAPQAPVAPAPVPPGAALPLPAATAVLSLNPADGAVAVGQETRLDVLVTNMQDLAGGSVTIGYDPKVLEFRQAIEGEFLKQAGGGAVLAEVNPLSGTVMVTLKRNEGAKGVSGAGVLATLSFAGKAPGVSPVTLQTPRLLNMAQAPLAATEGRGIVRVR